MKKLYRDALKALSSGNLEQALERLCNSREVQSSAKHHRRFLLFAYRAAALERQLEQNRISSDKYTTETNKIALACIKTIQSMNKREK